MRRLILFLSAFFIFGVIVLWSLSLRQTAVTNPPQNADQIAALLRAANTPEGQLAGQPVIFPPEAGTVVGHGFFPLTGGHALSDCAACHEEGVYRGTAVTCVACHAADDAHNGENGTECATCHTPTNWQDATFDHSTIGTRDCAECHTPPPNHFPAPCANCHLDTTNFTNVVFDHSTIGSQDCVDCHAPPPNHFPAPCARCHMDTANFRNVNFDHSVIGGQDCVNCHTPPPNHFPGACNACHQDTTNFRNASFDHSVIGNQDCSGCHAPPPNHFPGACRDCHQDTSNFRNATFDHAFPLGHGEANGQCSACHTNNDFSSYTCANCHSGERFIEKHSEEGITDLSNCVGCHPDGEKPDD
jgi:uncharacterized protein YjbI with pentapeptide repeats